MSTCLDEFFYVKR